MTGAAVPPAGAAIPAGAVVLAGAVVPAGGVAQPAGLPVAAAPDCPEWMVGAVRAAGADLVPPATARALIWTEPADPGPLAALLRAHPGIAWVQLPWAGVEPYVRAGLVDRGRLWSSAKGVYSGPVAEHALALALALVHDLKGHALRGGWGPQSGSSLHRAAVTIFGRGGIATELARLLRPFETTITCVTRTGEAVGWAHRVLALPRAGAAPADLAAWRAAALSGADLVVLALSLSPATERILGAAELAAMKPTGYLVNVARGAHVDTDALVAALRERRIAGAGLDVTDPEPLPAGHPLWTMPSCLITPHTAVTRPASIPLLAARITENLRRFADGRPLLGLVDPELGY